MRDIDDIRRDNLRTIETECGGTSSAATLLGMSPSQFANLRDGAKDSKTGKPRGMRKETARRIEKAAGKPAGWLDVDHRQINSNPDRSGNVASSNSTLQQLELSPEEQRECQLLRAIWNQKKAERGLTQQSVADELGEGKTQGSVSHYLNGKNSLNLSAALVFGRLLGVSIVEFSPRLHREVAHLEGRAEKSNVVQFPAGKVRSDILAISRLDVVGSMGPGKSAPTGYVDVIDQVIVNKDYLSRTVSYSNATNLSVITGFGDSMEGTYNDGDFLLVDRGVTEIKLDAVYVVRYHDDLFIKRFQRRPGKPMLMISDNKKYEPVEIKIKSNSDFEVLGRVLMAWNAKKL